MKKNLFVMFALIALVFVSCQKTEVYSDELTTSVIFNPVVKEDLSINKTTINRSALGDDFINVAIGSMDIIAEHITSGESVSDHFDIIDDNTGFDFIGLTDVRLGRNKFSVSTTSYIETPETDPVYWESDGFSSNNAVIQNDYPFSLSNDFINTTDSTVKYLRFIQPFVEFNGSTEAVVTYNECEDAIICNEVEIEMEAEQGRWIATVEFENVALASFYKATVNISHNANEMGPAPKRTVDLGNVNGSKVPFAWFYMTHAECNETLEITVQIDLREKDSNVIVRSWVLNSTTNPNEIAVKNGIDRWVQIIIGENSLKSGCVDFKFIWDWDTDYRDIIL